MLKTISKNIKEKIVKHISKNLKSKDGYVLIVTAGLLSVIFPVLFALVADLGHIYDARADLSNRVDLMAIGSASLDRANYSPRQAPPISKAITQQKIEYIVAKDKPTIKGYEITKFETKFPSSNSVKVVATARVPVTFLTIFTRQNYVNITVESINGTLMNKTPSK